MVHESKGEYWDGVEPLRVGTGSTPSLTSPDHLRVPRRSERHLPARWAPHEPPDCGLRIADCVLRHGSCPVSRSERNRELSMNLVASGVSRITSPQREPSPREIRADSRRLLRFMVPMRGERPWRLPRLAVAH